MLLNLLRFEWQFHTRQVVFYIALVACALAGYVLTSSQPMDSDIVLSGPYYITKTLCQIMMAVLPFLVAVFAGNATVRDKNSEITELVFSTTVSKTQFLASRWLGLVGVSTLVFLALSVGLMIGLDLTTVASATSAFKALMWGMLTLVIPAIILLSSLYFAIGLLSGKSIVIYIAATMVFIFYVALATATGSPLVVTNSTNETLRQVFMFIDPFGATAFFDQLRGWTPNQRNQQFFEFGGSLLLNRVVLMTAALAVMAFCYRRFAFTLPEGKKVKKAQTQTKKAAVPYQAVIAQQGLLSNWQAFVSLCKLEYLATIKTKVFAGVLVFLLFVLGSEIIVGLTKLESLGVTPVANTMAVLWRFQYDVLPIFTTLFLIYFAAQMSWRDVDLNSSSFTDATPVKNISLFLSKACALLLVPLTFITFAIFVAVTLQLAFGGNIEWSAYLALYYYNGLPLLCLAALFLFVHAISPNKVIGMTICTVVTLLSVTPAGASLGLEHGLFKFSKSPLIQYSQVIGFSANADAFAGYMSYWLGLSAIMVLVGFGLYRRGVDVSLLNRIRFVPSQWGKLGFAAVVISTLGSALLGAKVLHQTNEVGHYMSSQEQIQWRVDYENQFGKYQDMLSPKVRDVKTTMAFYPEQRKYALEGEYLLENTNAQVLNEILVSVHNNHNYQDLQISGATLQNYDQQFGQYLFKLKQPMQPGQTAKMTFKVDQQQNGYSDNNFENFIVPGFSIFQSARFMPMFGFAEFKRLSSPSLRQQYGLEPLPELTLEQEIAAAKGHLSNDFYRVNFATTVSTSADEIALAPGELVKQWQQDGRNFYQYQTHSPIRNGAVYASGDFNKATKKAGDIDVEVYYIDGHQANVEHILEAATATIDYAGNNFSAYPDKALRLIEAPRNVIPSTAYAAGQMIFMAEHVGFTADLSNTDAFDHVYRRTAHEVGHQWWGHGVNAASVEGESVLIETLAKYTELVLLEQKYGHEYVRQLMKLEHERYFSGRSFSTEHEIAMYRSSEGHVLYSKGAVAMYAIKQAIGEQAINRALNQLIAKHAAPLSAATTLDLIAQLKAATTGENAFVIDRWFNHVIVDETAIDSTEVMALAHGKFQVDICFSNSQSQLDTEGNVLNDYVRTNSVVAVLGSNPDFMIEAGDDANILKSEVIAVTSDRQCVSWTVDEQPKFVAVDPFYQLLDNNRENNVVAL